jgi:hypothetical protein
MRFTSDGTPGTIVLVEASLGRYSDFEVSLERLLVPTGTQLARIRGGSSALSQNVGVRGRTGEWVWFIDDDHTFEPDVLLRLLAHKVDVVAPLIPMRNAPYKLVLYKQLDLTECEGRVTNYKEAFYDFHDIDGQTGLIQVNGLPKAGCLIREKIWARMPMPIFKIGLIHPDDIEDDKYFMWEVRERYGVTLWCDTDQVINHLTTASIGCKRDSSGKYNRTVII